MVLLAQGEIDELKDSLKYAEYLLARTKEEKEHLESEVNQRALETTLAKKELQSKAKENSQAQETIEQLGKTVQFVEGAKERLGEVARGKLAVLSAEIKYREEEIARLKGQIEGKDGYVDKLQVTELVNREENTK